MAVKKKKNTQDTSPLAMGRQQTGSAAQKRAASTSNSNKTSSATNRTTPARTQQAQQQKSYGGYTPRQSTASKSSSGNTRSTGRQTQQSSQPTVSRRTQNTVERFNTKYGQNKVTRDPQQTRTAQERRNQAQRQKSGLNDAPTAEQSRAARRAIANTPSLVKKSLADVATGHGKTAADLTAATGSNASGYRLDFQSQKFIEDNEKRKKTSTRAAENAYNVLSDKQDARQAEWDKKSQGAKGLEKAYYGAVESGVGMATDLALGLGTQGGSLLAMASRTYGNTRGQAQKEGATENEDRLYSFMQAAKEVGTELMFPGIGLAKGYAGKAGLPLAERVANNLTKNMANRTAADLTGAGVRLLGGAAEENLEEGAGWLIDPLIKEFTYGKNVRTRQAQDVLKQESDALRQNIQSEEDAQRAASYLNSSEFIEQNKQQYMEAGLSEKQAEEVAELMRDYLTASLTGDTESMESIEQDIAEKVAGKTFSKEDWDFDELKDTIASTSLLTLTTGLPGTATSAMRGSAIRDSLGTDGIRALAETAMNFEDEEASKRGEVARDRINSGKELTSSQVYELAASQAQQIDKDTKRVAAKNALVSNTLESEKLVAPMISRTENGKIVGDSVITSRYNEQAQNAENVLKDLAKEQKLSLSDSEITIGSRAIAGFQTGAFTINDVNALNFTNTAVRTAFEKVTGIDLSQYIVKNKNGAVNYAETNAATKDALFAMAADNYIETARAETENFKDITKGITAEQMAQRVGSNGDAAISAALETVDPADATTYDLMSTAAQNVYEYGRFTNDSWSDVESTIGEMYPSLDKEALRGVYESARQDRAIAEDPYFNAVVNASDSMSNMNMSEANLAEYGKFTNDSGRDIGMKERAVFESLAREFNVNIRLMPSEFFEQTYTDKNGKEHTFYSNGTYDPQSGSILLNHGNDMERNIVAVGLHEVTHHIALYAPEEYMALSRAVMDRWYKNDTDAFNAAIKRKQDNYKRMVNQTLSEEAALEEVIADAVGEMSSDPDFISQICAEEPSLAQKIIGAIKDVLRKLRQALSSGRVAEEYEDAFFSQLGMWDDAQRLWMEAARAAQKARGNQLIDEWQEKANAPTTKYSIGYTKDNRPVVFVEENFLQGVSNEDRLRTAKQKMATFKPGIPVGNELIGITGKTAGHYVNSDYSKYIRTVDRKTYSDKLAAINNTDEILYASTDYVNEDLLHPRKDDIEAFARGHVLLDVSGSQYDAEVIVGIKKDNSLLYYDLENLQPIQLDVKEKRYGLRWGNESRTSMMTFPLEETIPSSESENKRFSLNEPVERVADLVAVHNLSEDNLKGDFDLGGLPMPSIAITKDSMGHEDYGDITLLFHSDTIDPGKRRSNEVFGGDAYTPTFPAISYKPNEAVENRISKVYYDTAKKYGYDAVRPMYAYVNELESRLNSAGGEQALIENVKKESDMQRLFLKTIDKDVEDVITTKEHRLAESDIELSEILIKHLGKDAVLNGMKVDSSNPKGILTARKQWIAEHKAELEAATEEYLRSADVPFTDEEIKSVLESIRPADYKKYIETAKKYLTDGPVTTTTEVDREATNEAVRIAAEENGYEQWVEELFAGVEEKKGIRNDRDPFTASGNRRKWETLHEPVTLAGVVRVMSNELSAGANGLLGANPKGAAQKKYRNLDEIRADEERLQLLPAEEYEQLESDALDKLTKVCRSIYENNPRSSSNTFGGMLGVGEAIAEILNETRTKDGIHRILTKEYRWDVTDAEMDDLMSAIDEIANLPTGYFEAKPRRAVGFDEVKAAIVPATASEEIKSGLRDRGVEVFEYDPETEGNRTEVLNQAATANSLRFSLNEMDDEYMSAVNSDNMEEAQRLVEQAASKAMPDTVLKGHWYHGTQNDFNIFDFSQGGKNGTAEGMGIYVTNDTDIPTQYGNRIIDGYVNMKRPASQLENQTLTRDELRNLINITIEQEAQENIDDYEGDLETAKKDSWISNYVDTYSIGSLDKAVDELINTITRFNGNDFEIIQEIMVGMGIRDFDSATKFYDILTETTGVDGFLTKWGDDEDLDNPDNPTIAVAFRSSQIKSADPVTYADDGSVIPLSERFDPNNDDIRYSLPTMDAEGNVLSDGQIEFFSNSMARDAQGRLVRVFHSTANGGFTIFDPSYSDDKRSIFFTSNYEMSRSYISYGEDFNPYAFSMPDTSAVKSVGDLKEWFDSLFDEKADAISIYLYDEEDNIYTDAPFYNSDNSLADYIEKYGNDYAQAKGEFCSKEGDIIGEFSSTEEMLKELQDCVEYLNQEAIGGTQSTSDSGTYACYLNLENPLIIDCEGSNWDSIMEPGFKKYNILRKGDSYFIEGSFHAYTIDELREEFGDGLADQVEKRNLKDSFALGGFYTEFYTYYGDAFDPEEEGWYPMEENTRYWCNEAEAMGYDGVIFRNLSDNGPHGYADLEGDVFVAFRSEQIKDIRNTDPTNNPDIRYSIVEEDEVLSRMAYEDAIEDSYEALRFYEELISKEPDFDVERNFGKTFNEERVSAFYSSLLADENVPFSDPVLEEGRVRMAKSRQDFWNNVNTKWNDRWTTSGEVLDLKSVKKDVRQLVMSVMNNSATDRQYKTDVVNKTLIDIRTAYQLMKQDRTDVASALLYHSALRMIENVEFINDDTFNNYRDLREYLRTTKISLGEEYWSDVDYQAFRKENFGRMKLVKGETNVDQLYVEMCELWPEWFKEDEEMTPPDQLEQIAHVLDVIQPYKEAYSSEECAELAFEIADDLYDIMANGREVKSLADKYQDKYDAKAEALKARYEQKLQNSKERYDQKTKAMKTRHAEALLRYRQQRDEGIQAERARWQEREAKRKERQLHKKYFERIEKNHKWLVDRLLTNTADKNIPEFFKKDLAKMLAAFDLQTVGSKKLEEKSGNKARKTIKMESLRTSLSKLHEVKDDFLTNDTITDLIDRLTKTVEGKTIDELSASELKDVSDLLTMLRHEFSNYNKVRVGEKREELSAIGHAQIEDSLNHADKFGAGRDFRGPRGWLDRIINMDELTPSYLFRRIDPNYTGIGKMFKQISRTSFDKYVRNTVQLEEWIDEITGEYKNKGLKKGSDTIEAWRSSNYSKTFNFEGGTVKLTPAQMMSLYCLAGREQAYGHMVRDGIVVSPVTFQAQLMSDLVKSDVMSLSVPLTDADIKTIIAELTPEQINVANKLQNLMADKMAAWGNEASQAVLGIKLFEDPNYFPIRSSEAGLVRDMTDDQFVQAIRNFGFTKAVQPNAGNAIMIDDIFDVVAEHCNNMNLYNSYSESMNDFMKVYNFKEYRLQDNGVEKPVRVKEAIIHAYSRKADTFIMSFMKDLNGNVSRGKRTGIDDAFNDALNKAKKASVFANGRVALQQPTAIVRAFDMISPKYAKDIRVSKGLMEEMFEHCPRAKWKSLGYYDINMGKNIEDVIMNNGNLWEDVATGAYGALDNITWTAMWGMVKGEIKDTHPNVKVGSEEYWNLCNERFSDIIDFTQVIDSPIHRSHAMRSKNFMDKLSTSFAAEPTLTYNMMRDGFVQAAEMWKSGDKAGATKLLSKKLSVFTSAAFVTGAMAAIWDVVRGKGQGDDDDDQLDALQLWWANTVENFKDGVKLWNNIYYIKDAASLLDGWEINNLALQGFKYIGTAWQQLQGNKYVRSQDPWYMNLAYGIGYLTGVPTKTVLNDGRKILNMFGSHIDSLDKILASADDKLDNTLGAVPEKYQEMSEKVSLKTAVGALALTGYKLFNEDADISDLSFDKGSPADTFVSTIDKKKVSAKSDSDKSEYREGAMNVTVDGFMTDEELEADTQDKIAAVQNKVAGLSGTELNEAVFNKVNDQFGGYTKVVESGNFKEIERMRDIIEAAGGDVKAFDEKVLKSSKTAYKKTLGDSMKLEQQWATQKYLREHGVTAEEISELCYKSYTAKDLKAAFRLGNRNAIKHEMTFLASAGMLQEDFEKAYKYRNRYQNYTGKYSDDSYLESINALYEKLYDSSGTYSWPVSGRIITSHFGHRNSPGGIGSTNHKGLDIAGSMGDPISASDAGEVIYVGWYGGGGNTVRIRHSDGTITEYMHMSGFNCHVGDKVGKGDQIGQVGSTGNSTGPHCHFGVIDPNGNYLDPEDILNAAS